MTATKPEGKKGSATKASKPEVAKEPKAPSTKSIVVPIIKKMIDEKVQRKDIISMLKADYKMTEAGAATYVQNVKSGKWVK